ncbi:MAG TPA: type II toxin-antitoxin system death-on-curing family toxin [Planctomycetota bacterium]|nr:type II toxin-antitoxin system death-on-curing family toxin [Planctomycetota bacterium]
MSIRFLTVAEVTALHDAGLGLYGGETGLVAGEGLLESAVMAPQAGTADGYLHADLFEMAAAYLYHIVLDHPFMDGNKRAGCAAAMTFLKLNGRVPFLAASRLRDLAIQVQTHRLSKRAIAAALRGPRKRRPRKR